MKKSIFLALVFASLCITADAQIGLRAGVNGTNVKSDLGSGSFSGSTALNFQLGIVIDVPTTSNLSFRSGLLFNQKGASEKENGIESVSFSYLEIPLHLLFEVHPFIFLEAGPYLGYLLSASSLEEDIKESLSKADIGLNFGGGVQLSKFSVGLHYNFGLSNIAKNDDATINVSAKNNGFTLYGVFSF